MDLTNTSPAADVFPSEILALPKVEVPVAGVTGYSLRDDEKQVVFFLFDEGVSVPDHAHCEQHGMVVSGEMVLEVEGKTNLYTAGESYRVPGGVTHRASFSKPTLVIDMSNAPDRYVVRD
jgi:quercetin dioxygenase-like cupin family protein